MSWRHAPRSGTTDIAIFYDGTVRHSAVLGVGGSHLTNDIAAGLRTPTADAERIKQRYGLAKASMVAGDERLEVPSVGGKTAGTVSRQILCEIIEPRMEEVFQLVQREIARSGYEGCLASGIVMAGGAMLLPGAAEMAEQFLGLPVRLGIPTHVGGLVDVVSSPVYAAGVGLVLYGSKCQESVFSRCRDDRILSKVKHRMSDWLSEFF
jgi:cell division protein FtsA